MAKNDIVLIDSIIQERKNKKYPSDDIGEVFEYFALEQILKNYDLSKEKIELGWLDGRGDGGIDGIYIFINGILYTGIPDFVWPKSTPEITLWIISCKHHNTFKQGTLDALFPTLQEFFDLTKESTDIAGCYSPSFHQARANLFVAIDKLASYSPILKINIVYASRGDASEIGEEVSARKIHLEKMINGLFSNCSVSCLFYGATELIGIYRKIRLFSLPLPFVEHLSHDENNYVIISTLSDYYKFVSDENGNLRRYLFESNVRDFLGYNAVNSDIEGTLKEPESPNFWWLNNGVTILGTNAHVQGKNLYIDNIQIVNGLQTTETIYRHFSSGTSVSKEKNILIKVLITESPETRNSIIKATNNQSNIAQYSLHATDKIQRDIEEILLKYDFYYVRRDHYYKNEGKPTIRFVEPLYLASGFVALVLKNPFAATKLKNRFMQNAISYNTVFSDIYPLEIWVSIANVYKQTDYAFYKVIDIKSIGEIFVASWRATLALCTIALYFKTISYTHQDLLTLKNEVIPPDFFIKAWETIAPIAKKHKSKKISQEVVLFAISKIAKLYNLSGQDEICKRTISSFVPALSSNFINEVDALLPKQPWPIGIHKEIAYKLHCKENKVSRAIGWLMFSKKRDRQKDGIVYGLAGNVIAVDSTRCHLT